MRVGGWEVDHRLSGEAYRYTNQILSESGERLNRHEVWKVQARAYDSTARPGRAESGAVPVHRAGGGEERNRAWGSPVPQVPAGVHGLSVRRWAEA